MDIQLRSSFIQSISITDGITTMLGVLNFHTSTMVYSTISVPHITYNGLPHGISTMRGVLDFAEVSQRFRLHPFYGNTWSHHHSSATELSLLPIPKKRQYPTL